MKLRNQITGEIKELQEIMHEAFCEHNEKSLMNLEKEWEEYEEPKEYWFIDEFGLVQKEIDYFYEDNKEAVHNKRMDVGNYFETKEEAVAAVEKLKAYKRLKDKGFRFSCYMRRSDWAGYSWVKALQNLIDITAYLPKEKIKEAESDLELLFGGENETTK